MKKPKVRKCACSKYNPCAYHAGVLKPKVRKLKVGDRVTCVVKNCVGYKRKGKIKDFKKDYYGCKDAVLFGGSSFDERRHLIKVRKTNSTGTLKSGGRKKEVENIHTWDTSKNCKCEICKPSYPKLGNPEIDLREYFNTHHPCRKCKGFVPDGAIICVHCRETNP